MGSECASAFECASTERMPSSRQVRMIRSAISPRLAIRILWNTRGLAAEEAMPLRFDLDQPQPVHAERRVVEGVARGQPDQQLAHRLRATAVEQVAHDPEG